MHLDFREAKTRSASLTIFPMPCDDLCDSEKVVYIMFCSIDLLALVQFSLMLPTMQSFGNKFLPMNPTVLFLLMLGTSCIRHVKGLVKCYLMVSLIFRRKQLSQKLSRSLSVYLISWSYY